MNAPTGPFGHEPLPPTPDADPTPLLFGALHEAGVQLGDYDWRTALWLTAWGWGTPAAVAGWVRRAAANGAGKVAATRAEVLREVADLWMERSDTATIPRERMDLRQRAHELREMADAAEATPLPEAGDGR